jgi:hypothetical protein
MALWSPGLKEIALQRPTSPAENGLRPGLRLICLHAVDSSSAPCSCHHLRSACTSHATRLCTIVREIQAPFVPRVTPTGRPQTVPSLLTKPVMKSSRYPEGTPKRFATGKAGAEDEAVVLSKELGDRCECSRYATMRCSGERSPPGDGGKMPVRACTAAPCRGSFTQIQGCTGSKLALKRSVGSSTKQRPASSRRRAALCATVQDISHPIMSVLVCSP